MPATTRLLLLLIKVVKTQPLPHWIVNPAPTGAVNPAETAIYAKATRLCYRHQAVTSSGPVTVYPEIHSSSGCSPKDTTTYTVVVLFNSYGCSDTLQSTVNVWKACCKMQDPIKDALEGQNALLEGAATGTDASAGTGHLLLPFFSSSITAMASPVQKRHLHIARSIIKRLRHKYRRCICTGV